MPKVVNLALQGGGSHGAFTWGVLDRLLEEERLSFEGISATSAGAVNAVVLAMVWPPAAVREREKHCGPIGKKCQPYRPAEFSSLPRSTKGIPISASNIRWAFGFSR